MKPLCVIFQAAARQLPWCWVVLGEHHFDPSSPECPPASRPQCKHPRTPVRGWFLCSSISVHQRSCGTRATCCVPAAAVRHVCESDCFSEQVNRPVVSADDLVFRDGMTALFHAIPDS